MRWKPLLNVGRLQRNFLHYWLSVSPRNLQAFTNDKSYRNVFVLMLIAFIPLHLTDFYQILSTNVNLRIMQDLLLDVTGSISMSYEMVLQPKENGRQLDHSSILSCLTKSMQLLGNVNEHISSKRRTQVLTKNGQKYTSLSNEIWENNGREHFGPQFEH